MFTHASLSFLLKQRELKSSNDKLSGTVSQHCGVYFEFCKTIFVKTAVLQLTCYTLVIT